MKYVCVYVYLLHLKLFEFSSAKINYHIFTTLLSILFKKGLCIQDFTINLKTSGKFILFQLFQVGVTQNRRVNILSVSKINYFKSWSVIMPRCLDVDFLLDTYKQYIYSYVFKYVLMR